MPDQRATRVASLLNAYYTMDEGDDGASPPEAPNQTSTEFDAEGRFEEMIRGSSLTELVKKAAEEASTLKRMEQEREGLLYENYTKFLKAGESISSLGKAIDGLGPVLLT